MVLVWCVTILFNITFLEQKSTHFITSTGWRRPKIMVRSHGWQRTCKSTFNVEWWNKFSTESALRWHVHVQYPSKVGYQNLIWLITGFISHSCKETVLVKFCSRETKLYLQGGNLHEPLSSNVGGWREILFCNDDCVHVYLLTNFCKKPSCVISVSAVCGF